MVKIEPRRGNDVHDDLRFAAVKKRMRRDAIWSRPVSLMDEK